MWAISDMLAATSVLQQRATDIRSQRINWQSYQQSQMISQEDYNFIVAFDVNDSQARERLLKTDRLQCAKTFMNLLGHVSKDQTLQYILVLVDDMIQEDRTRVEIFHEHVTPSKDKVWGPFLNLLSRQDGFITNMTSRIIAKIACWAQTPMDRSDLHFYLTWLKDQLKCQYEDLKANYQIHGDLSKGEPMEIYTEVSFSIDDQRGDTELSVVCKNM